MLKIYPKMGMAIAFILLGAHAFSQCIPPLNQTVTPANTTVICGGNATVNVASTETGISYFLRNAADNSIVDGPVAGTGSSITFNTGTVTSSATYNVYADKLTAGLHFDGINDYVSSPEITMGATFTFETWVKTNDDSPEWSGIITTNTRAGSGMFAQFALANDGTLRWESNSPNSYVPNMTTLINDNVWHHVAVVSDGSSLTFYVDGNVENTISFAAGSFTRNIQFMAEREAGAFVPGTMDEARVWSVARTQSEIQASMNGCNLTGTETGLEIYYKFEDGAGSSTVTDLAGGDQDGILVNTNVNTAWGTGIADCNFCPSEMLTKPSITVNAITDQAISAAAICSSSGSTTIDLASSEVSVDYYLRNDLDDAIVAGPMAGTGAGISFNTGTISTNTTYNVLADRPSPTTSLHFDGNNYISVPSGISIDNRSFTIDFWAKKTAGNYIFGQGSNGNTNLSLHIGYRNNTTFTFAFFNNDLDVDLSNTNAIDGNYHRWTCVYNAGQSGIDRFVYLDGTLVGSDDASGDFQGAGEFRIGTHMFQSGSFAGDIDEVRVWDRALTQAETQDALNSLTGSESGLIAYYTMNNVSNPTLTDVSGNGNDGTLINMNPAPLSFCQLEMTQTATVTVNSSTTSTITITSCDSYTAPDNAVYTTSGIKTAVIPNAAGCDSTITIDLTINTNTVDASLTQNGNTLTANATGATYTWKNCTTNNVIAGETSQSYMPTADGDYAVTVTENTCSATSTCITVTTTGISSKSNFDSKFSVYPNPNSGSFVIKSNGEGTYSIVNNLGQTIQTIQLTGTQTSYEINNLDNGVYFIVGYKDNQVTRQKMVVSK